jgi:hypothetical protein
LDPPTYKKPYGDPHKKKKELVGTKIGELPSLPNVTLSSFVTFCPAQLCEGPVFPTAIALSNGTSIFGVVK